MTGPGFQLVGPKRAAPAETGLDHGRTLVMGYVTQHAGASIVPVFRPFSLEIVFEVYLIKEIAIFGYSRIYEGTGRLP